jgi:hypothetical protein
MRGVLHCTCKSTGMFFACICLFICGMSLMFYARMCYSFQRAESGNDRGHTWNLASCSALQKWIGQCTKLGIEWHCVRGIFDTPTIMGNLLIPVQYCLATTLLMPVWPVCANSSLNQTVNLTLLPRILSYLPRYIYPSSHSSAPQDRASLSQQQQEHHPRLFLFSLAVPREVFEGSRKRRSRK